jgi:hypothetical protein
MPFGMGIVSDHRFLWLEIGRQVWMGQDLEQPSKFAARWFKCDDPRVRNIYIKHYKKYIEKKQLSERFKAISTT